MRDIGIGLVAGALAGAAAAAALAVLGGLSVGSGHGSDLPLRLAFVVDHPAGIVMWPVIGILLSLRERLWACATGLVLLAGTLLSAGVWVFRETGSLQLVPQLPDATVSSSLGLVAFGSFELVAWVLFAGALIRRFTSGAQAAGR